MANIYVASSWRNQYYPDVVNRLKEAGHEVYDFRNPPQGTGGFHWSDVDAGRFFRNRIYNIRYPIQF